MLLGSRERTSLARTFSKPYQLSLRTSFSDAFARALTLGTWEVSYECSSPDLFRKYRMRVHALKSRAWLMVTNPLIYESPHR